MKKMPDKTEEVDKKKYRLIITLTKEEYELFERVHKLNGRPIATNFMECVRELGVFGFASKCFWVAEKIVKYRDSIADYKQYSLFLRKGIK